jgi:Zn-finger nucleic acid-binding protein
MNCPVCSVSLSITDRAGIEIDYCPTCRGVWLDRGELDKIIERAGTPVAPPERARTEHYDTDRGAGQRNPHNPMQRPHGHKRENPIADLFDFF